MKMYFDVEQKPACDVALQTETGEVFTYGELREQIAEFQACSPPTQLCFFIM